LAGFVSLPLEVIVTPTQAKAIATIMSRRRAKTSSMVEPLKTNPLPYAAKRRADQGAGKAIRVARAIGEALQASFA
jgi:hypothetical protein